MRSKLVFCALGIIGASYFPVLPPSFVCLPLLILVVALWCHPKAYPLAGLAFGVFWGVSFGYIQSSTWIDDDYYGRDIYIEGVITGLPKKTDRGIQFDIHVDRATAVQSGTAAVIELDVKKLKLTWYADRSITPGETWALQVRLKRPRGAVNPGGFDYHAWLMRNDYDAVGYVRKSQFNQQQKTTFLNRTFTVIDSLRFRVVKDIERLLDGKASAGLIKALVVGDKSDIAAKDWSVLKATGTVHLIVISGLHIGFISTLVFGLVIWSYRFLMPIGYQASRREVAAAAAIVAGVFYAAFAGFSLPTIRAVIMIVVAMACIVSARKIPLNLGYFYALLIVLLLDPLAAHGAGFWLSFGAVGVLLYGLSNRVAVIHWLVWFRAQWIVFVGLGPILLYFIYSLSLLSPLVNIIAIPVVSFTVVPTALLGSLFLLLAPTASIFEALAKFSLSLSESILYQLWRGLEWVTESSELSLWEPEIVASVGALCILVLGICWLLSPRGMPAKCVIPLYFLPLILPMKSGESHGGYEMTVLDVGQGLALVVETRNHTLVFDTGPKYSDRADAGSHTVLPFLASKGISKIDHLVVSHSDNDHAGGAISLLRETTVDAVSAGNLHPLKDQLTLLHNKELIDQAEGDKHLSVGGCLQGQEWVWDGVHFEFLNPKSYVSNKSNNRSCVLMIDNGSTRVLIPGDIEKRVELRLVRDIPEKLRADIIIAPHHGSKTSSSSDFLAHVLPRWVIFSSGYRNHFGHPHSTVVDRYRKLDSQVLNTAEEGALVFRVGAEPGDIEVEKLRRQHQRYWYVI